MLYATKGIALHYIKYSETSVIVHIYTKTFGRQAYLINGIRKAQKKRKTHMALLQPFSLLDMQVYHNTRAHIQRIKDLALDMPLQSIPFDVHKRSMAMFLAEVLTKVLREEESNPRLFDFLHHFTQIFDLSQENTSNMHLVFLMQLSKHLGFSPYQNFSDSTPVFDMQKGYFVASPPDHRDFLHGNESRVFNRLLGANFSNYHELYFSFDERSEMLDRLLHYYKLHIQGMGAIKSLDIMRTFYH